MASRSQHSPGEHAGGPTAMNSLIVFLSVVGVAFGQWGHSAAGPQETPEVAAARAAHLSALAAAGGNVPAPAAQSWNSNPNPGVPADTPEVAAAKAAHFAALARAGSPAPQAAAPSWNQGQYNQGQYDQGQYDQGQYNQGQYNPAPANNYGSRWQGPLALPPGFDASGAPLPVQDTPEVQAERAHHLALAARAGAPAPAYPQAAPAWNQQNSWNQPAAQSWSQPAQSWNQPAAQSWNQPAAQSWNQPAAQSWNQPAAPAGLPADTPEVAAAKAAHFAAHQAASGHRYRRSLIAAPIAYASPLALHPAPLALHPAPLAFHQSYLRHAFIY